MNTSYKTVLALIKTIVTGKDQMPSYAVNWMEVIDIATKQGVLGLCFDAIEILPAEKRPDLDSLMEWLGQVSYMEDVYDEYKKSIEHLAELYRDINVKMMVLKGYGLSLCWPKPIHRPIGDLDTYNFGLHAYADKMIQKKCGVKIDNNHHKHSVFSFESITVENHYSFLNIHGHRSTAEIERILMDDVKQNYVADKGISNVYFPSVNFNSLYLLRHCGEHFASVDMNLRQVLDWAFFVRSNKVDWEWLLGKLDRVGMKKYLAVINAICVKYLGFETSLFPELSVDERLVKRSLRDVLHPEVEKERHTNTLCEIVFRFKRWWKNGWKHDMVYRESRWSSLITQMWSHMLKPSL